ncbi:hypothetical protein [Candidatus Ichthyocystis hellenicum]|uniref:hypothetical protein n=1 Tax=Candidatus Ichthyocystis hellenicum TaxID=1561003 RepID=UPI000B83CF08|nr:hypothetical protein [Candidatus Ichthyocystis hellenicum]
MFSMLEHEGVAMEFSASPGYFVQSSGNLGSNGVVVDIDSSDSGGCFATAGASSLSSLLPSSSSSGVSTGSPLCTPLSSCPPAADSPLLEVVVDHHHGHQRLYHEDSTSMRRAVAGLETVMLIARNGLDASVERDSSCSSIDSVSSVIDMPDLVERVERLESFAESVSPELIRPYVNVSSNRRCAAFVRCFLYLLRSPSPAVILLRKVFLFFFSSMVCDWLTYSPCDWVESRGFTCGQLVGGLCRWISSACRNR